MGRATILGAAALLAGCGGGGAEEEAAPLNEQQLSETIVEVAEARPDPTPGPPGPSLVGISREDVEGALPPGAGCDFLDGGELLFAARSSGQALARVNGLAVSLRAEGPVGPNGGFFTTPRYRLSIAPLSRGGVEIARSTTWPAQLVLTDRRSGEKTSELRREGTWRCGA
ncbi:MAG TPA: hypothetical protein VEZ20_00050 [Allosphingosinicella sp.]|nr:hypothetical protein [Allosphingosinicella sp.]